MFLWFCFCVCLVCSFFFLFANGQIALDIHSPHASNNFSSGITRHCSNTYSKTGRGLITSFRKDIFDSLSRSFTMKHVTWEKSSSVICDQRTPRSDTASVVFSVEKSISALVWHDLTPKIALGFNMAIKALRHPSCVQQL